MSAFVALWIVFSFFFFFLAFAACFSYRRRSQGIAIQRNPHCPANQQPGFTPYNQYQTGATSVNYVTPPTMVLPGGYPQHMMHPGANVAYITPVAGAPYPTQGGVHPAGFIDSPPGYNTQAGPAYNIQAPAYNTQAPAYSSQAPAYDKAAFNDKAGPV